MWMRGLVRRLLGLSSRSLPLSANAEIAEERRERRENQYRDKTVEQFGGQPLYSSCRLILSLLFSLRALRSSASLRWMLLLDVAVEP